MVQVFCFEMTTAHQKLYWMDVVVTILWLNGKVILNFWCKAGCMQWYLTWTSVHIHIPCPSHCTMVSCSCWHPTRENQLLIFLYFLCCLLLFCFKVNQTDEVLNKIDLQSPLDGILGSGMEDISKLWKGLVSMETEVLLHFASEFIQGELDVVKSFKVICSDTRTMSLWISLWLTHSLCINSVDTRYTAEPNCKHFL